MNLIWADHVLAVVLAVLSAPAGARSAARLARRIRGGDARARLRFYYRGIAQLWGLALVIWLLWRWTDRPFDALGIVAPTGVAAWISAGLCAATLGFYAMQVKATLASEAARASVRAQLKGSPGVAVVLPTTPAEMRGFVGVGITAGLCEELLYRGYILWYFSALLPRGWAIAATVAVFGIGHAYQGVRGVLLTGVVGGIALGVYLGTGSLLAPIVMHAAVDVANGFIAYRAKESSVRTGPAGC